MIELLTTHNIVMGISVLVNIVLLIGVRNLLKQNEQLEDRVMDDEVGVSFTEIKKIIEDLNKEL